MAVRPLSESFEAFGEWYLPDQPQRLIPGRLRYTPEHTELRLNDAFHPMHGSIRASDGPDTYPIIYGTTVEGEAVTLLRVQRLGVSINVGSGGMRQPERLITSWMLIGQHMPADFTYPTVRFRVPGLQVWLSRQTIEQTFQPNEPGSGASFRVLPVDREITMVPAIDATIEWGIGWNATADHFSSIAVEVSGWVSIKPNSPRSIEWYLEQQNKLAPMMAFLGGVPMSPDCIEATTDDSLTRISVMVALRNVRYCTSRNLFDFFLPRREIEVDLAEVVARWFEIYAKFNMPCQLALSVFASEALWLHVEFISLMQALEGLHRALFDGTYMEEEAYKQVESALVSAIPASVSRDHRDSLRSRLRYANEVSLRKRLTALAQRLSEPIREKVFGGSAKAPGSWVDTRNYYTHWDETLRDNVLDGEGMYHANVRMRHFLRVLYLDLMQVPQGAILRALSNGSSPSQQLTQLNAIDRVRVGSNDSTDANSNPADEDSGTRR